MLGNLWNRLTGRSRHAAAEREAELEQMSPEERRIAEEGVENVQADDFVGGHLGGIDPGRLLGDDEPSRSDVPYD